MLKRFGFRPGIIRDVTQYTNEQGWYDADKVRFYAGFPEMIGGWTRYSTSYFQGTPRSLISYTVLSGTNLTGIGTTVKYYLERGGTYYDITPIRKTTSPMSNNPFTSVANSNIVTITDAGHGAGVGDFVSFTGATDFNGLDDVIDLNIEHKIINVIDANSYQILTPSTATLSGAGGGAAVVASYQANVGTDTVVAGTGWGAGTWSGGPWGGPASTSVPGSQIRIWSHDKWGEDLFINPLDGGIYFWDQSTSTLGVSRAVDISSLGGDTDVPTVAKQVMLSDVARHLIAFGCDDLSSSTQDPLMVRWSESEDYLVWTPDTTNQAGSYRLESGSKIVAAAKARNEILIWTDTSLYTMNYLGGTFVFGFDLSSDRASIIGPNAHVNVENVTYWMDYGHFNYYNGTVNLLECPLQRYIFNDFNFEQRFKCFAGTVEDYNEIWWFYCSADSNEIDRYVIFNYLDNTWSMGSLFRSCWIETARSNNPLAGNFYEATATLGSDPISTINGDSTLTVTHTNHGAMYGDIVTISGAETFNSVNPNNIYVIHTIVDANTYKISIAPTATGTVNTASGTGSGGGSNIQVSYPRGYLYNQENGNNDELGNALTAYIESNDFDLDDGDHFIYIRRVMPDVEFVGSGASQSVDFSLKVRNSPAASKSTKFTRTVQSSTTQIWDRARGRQASVRWESAVVNTKWRIGSLRIDINQDGLK